MAADSGTKVVRKAVAYVTRNEHVLFFRAVEMPELGAELPGGTLLEGEEPEAGVLRELREETGLRAFGDARLLGVVNYDPGDGENEIHERHFYHVPLLEETPRAWERSVKEGNGVFTFSFFWVDRESLPPKIYPGHDAFLPEVLGCTALAESRADQLLALHTELDELERQGKRRDTLIPLAFFLAILVFGYGSVMLEVFGGVFLVVAAVLLAGDVKRGRRIRDLQDRIEEIANGDPARPDRRRLEG